MIDLRSDTVTKPTPAMKEAMMQAEVGDDVFKEDPTVNKLEKRVAEMFGMEAGLFVPSGTMGNQLALHMLTKPGDEVICDQTAHIFNYESGAAGFLSGIQLRTVQGRNGIMDVEQVSSAIRTTHDWDPHTRVIAVENSANRGGGTCYTTDELNKIRNLADEHHLFVHLDGARIWNASLATETDLSFYGSVADTISVCFSKGLGAPVGSMVLGDRDLITRARRVRKMLGGGMRQVGVLAAAADYALTHHIPLLVDDHRRARSLAKTIMGCSTLQIDLSTVKTNILMFSVREGTAGQALQKLESENILMSPFGPKTIRAVFHLQITDDDMNRLNAAIRKLFG